MYAGTLATCTNIFTIFHLTPVEVERGEAFRKNFDREGRRLSVATEGLSQMRDQFFRAQFKLTRGTHVEKTCFSPINLMDF
jgi:hypothetical protein